MTFDPREDPRWQQAHTDYIDDERDNEDPDAVFVRRVNAAFAMRQIEKEYEARNRTSD
jgi:catabolite regulation protein CreA